MTKKKVKFVDLKIKKLIKNQNNHYKGCVWFYKDYIFLRLIRLIIFRFIPRVSVFSLCSLYRGLLRRGGSQWPEMRPVTFRYWVRKSRCFHQKVSRVSIRFTLGRMNTYEELKRFLSVNKLIYLDLYLCRTLVCLNIFGRM